MFTGNGSVGKFSLEELEAKKVAAERAIADKTADLESLKKAIAAELKTFPKVMKSANGTVVFFVRPGEGYALTSGSFVEKYAFSDMWATDAFVDFDLEAAFKASGEVAEPDYPCLTMGKTSGCMYLHLSKNTHIRLTNGSKWTRFRNAIGVLAQARGFFDKKIIGSIG
jgi:hypothetical protein